MRLDGNDCSVHPAVIGLRVEVLADLARVRVLCDGRVVADHERLWARHQTVSAVEHVTAAKALRAARGWAAASGPECRGGRDPTAE